MSRITSAAAVLVLLSGLFGGQFTHLHDHDHETPALIHAHLPQAHDADVADEHEAIHIESGPGGAHGTLLDVFTLVLASASAPLYALETVSSFTPLRPAARIPVSHALVRAHGPPASKQLPPRSPPLSEPA